MKISIKKIFIVLILAFQLYAMAAILFDPLHGDFDSSYRIHERIKALFDWKQNPSASSKATYDEELRRLDSYLWTRDAVIILILAFEAVGVYYLWNYEAKKPMA
jgi:hypothetical protein